MHDISISFQTGREKNDTFNYTFNEFRIGKLYYLLKINNWKEITITTCFFYAMKLTY